MRFIPIKSASKLKVGSEVFTLNDKSQYAAGKLVSRIENGTGTELTFEVPQYFNPDAPIVKPTLVNNITHVAQLKERSQKEDEK